MEIHRLAALVESAEVHQRLLGDYSGAYSIGVIADPADPASPAIRVRVQGPGAPDIPSGIVLDGERVSVITHTRFVPPSPLSQVASKF